jgi:hypothetical protein
MLTMRTILVSGAVLTAAAFAAPPVEPLPAPLYSFDLASPTVQSGIVGASDILALAFPFPEPIVPGENLGLYSPLDDLDGFTFNQMLPPGAPFALLFSVDRETLGMAPPDPELLMLGRPFNAQDQAARGQAAGDQFLSLEAFTRPGGATRARAANNVLVRNNYDEGGTDFSAQPPTHAQDTSSAPEDNVDGTGQPAAGIRGLIPPVYFTASAASPSLLTLPGGSQPSGAHVFVDPDPLGDSPTFLYASFNALGLQHLDDIDALLVFDAEPYSHYMAPDVVLFSLSPESPSLQLIDGASPFGAAADIFVARPGQMPQVFAPAELLGLGEPSDNIDALELLACPDPLDCASLHAIQANRGDLDCDNDVDFGDINPFVLALSNPAVYALQFPDCPVPNGDIDGDGVIGFGDINPFVQLLSGTLGPEAE